MGLKKRVTTDYMNILTLLYVYYMFLRIGVISKCLSTKPDISPKRHFYYKSTSLPITIETSDRTSHQLLSRILQILLVEELGYARVDLSEGYNSMDANVILNRLSGNSGRIPETMVNLEVWIQAGFNVEAIVSKNNLVNVGPIGSSGRFGWFMTRETVEEKWNSSKISIDHWKSLTLPSVASLFSLNDQILDYIANISADSEPRNESSSSPSSTCLSSSLSCQRNICYTRNSSCLKTNDKNCAVLLSSYPDLYGDLVLQQMDNLKLDVGVAWLCNNLNSVVEKVVTSSSDNNNKTPLLFFNWTPNDLTAGSKFSRMLFPMCQTSRSPPVDCDFEIHQLSKIVWSAIKSHTSEAYHVISQMEFSQHDLDELLLLFRLVRAASSTRATLSEVLEGAACEWVRGNAKTWTRWIPESLSSKIPIYIGGMFPLTGPYWRQPGIVPGALMAVEYVNRDPNILPDYELTLLVQDTQCKVDIAMTQFLQYVVNKTHPIAGILGPGCSETAEPIAGVSKHFNTIVISYSAEAVQLTNRVQFPFFFRTIPHILQNGGVYVELFNRWNWQQVALLAEDGQNFPEYHAFLKDLFLSRAIQVTYDRKMPSQSKMEDAAKHIDELKKKDVKIIILTSFEQAARAVMCEAYIKGLTARNGYIWFLPPWFTESWWDAEKYNQLPHFPDKVPCTSGQMQEAVEGHFFFNTAYLGPLDSHIVGNRTVKQWLDAYISRMSKLGKEGSTYASYAYDAVLVFALSLHQLLTQDPSSLESLHTDATVERFMFYLNNTHFSGASGPVQFSGADRPGIINVHQHVGVSSVLVGQFSPDSLNITDRLFLKNSLIRWFTNDGRRPSDGTPLPKKCSIEDFRLLLGVECDMAIVIANIIGISLFVLVMVLSLIFVKKRYDRNLRKIKEEIGLDSYTSMFSWNKWQIPRDRVVLNRKLGEGTSGMVYGGEALINDEWVAVAVKTLKPGSGTEDKLDFLSEAEMMKQFDHKNIIKLIGVCTVGEPAFMIMEFMLHGDLKTFLLSRRQLVGQMTKEAEDVSPHALTQMALDIAQGLKYLSDLKYVHRDLACRNCLVHSGKTVRIGDFGMTKPMYDSDYYRFSKRGKFPVRWMAPESLIDGLFTTSSDVWSYGVLLFEIMTFGSFPYQGHSNRDVLELVKAGKRIELPQMCSPKVEMLLFSCWELCPKNRPTIDGIVELLEQNRLLLDPCLDVPSSALVLEGTASLEMNLGRFKTLRHRLGSDRSALQLGVSISSQDGESRVSDNDDCAPDVVLSPDVSCFLGKRSSLSTYGCSASTQRDSRSTRQSPQDTTSQQQQQQRYHRFTFDSFKRTKFGRSLSTDERTVRPPPLSCHFNDVSFNNVNKSVSFGKHPQNCLAGDTPSEPCSCAEATPMMKTLPTSVLDSKTNISNSCSQHSKNFL